jgi:hypothetical protein
VIEGSLYIASKNHLGRYIQHCDRDALPYGSSPGNARALFAQDAFLEVPVRDPTASMSAIGPSLSPAGLSVAYVSFPTLHSNRETTSFQFLPAMYKNGSVDSSPLVFDRVPVRLTLSGDPLSLPTSHSGACAVFACYPDDFDEEQEQGVRLRLIRYRKDPAAIDVTQLDLPSFITLHEATLSIGIDDHRGVVFLRTEEYLYALPYA